MSAQTTTRPVGHDVLGPAAEATQRLYEVYGAQVFGYCLGRLGSRPEAEDAVEKTFGRAANALSRGELPDQELPWLLRISDRVCSSRRRLAWIRSRADATWLVPPTDTKERLKIVTGWQGRTFEEIASEYDDRTTRLMQARGDLAATLGRGPLAIFPLGPVFGWVKTLFGGASALKVGAAALAVTASTVVVATPLADTLHDAVRPAAAKPDERAPAVQPTSRSADDATTRAQRSSPGTQRRSGTRASTPTKRSATAKPVGTRSVPRAGSTAGVGAGGSSSPAGGGEQGSGAPTSQPSSTGGSNAPAGDTTSSGTDAPKVSTPPAPTLSTPSTPTVSTPTVTAPGGGTQTTPIETPTLPEVPSVDTPSVDAPALDAPAPNTSVDLPKTSVP